MVLITKETAEETFNRIIKKFESVNYQPGFTLPYDIAPWYVVITELRLLTLSPFIVFVKYAKKEKPIHNIIEQEFNIIKDNFLPNRLFPLPSGKITNANNFNVEPVNSTKIFKITYGTKINGNLKPEFWGNLNKNLDLINSNLKKINRAIVFSFPDEKWSIWIFGNANDFILGKINQNDEAIEIKLPANLTEEQFKNGGLNGLNILYDKLGIILDRQEIRDSFSIQNKETIEKKDLFPISEYKQYHEKLVMLEIDLPLEIFGIEEETLKKRLSQGFDRAFEEYVYKSLEKKFKIFAMGKIDKNEFAKYYPRKIREKITLFEFKRRLRKFLIYKLGPENLLTQKNLMIFLKTLENTPYFKILYTFFSQIYNTISTNIIKNIGNKTNISFDLLFNTLGEEFERNLIVSSSWLERWFEWFHSQSTLEQNLKKKIKLYKENIWNHYYKTFWRFRYKIGEIKGLAGYVDRTNYPEFSVLINPALKPRDERIKLSSEKFKDFCQLTMLDNNLPVDLFQVPCVYTWFDENNEKELSEVIKKKLNEISQHSTIDIGKIYSIIDKIMQETNKENKLKKTRDIKRQIEKQMEKEKDNHKTTEMKELIEMLKILEKLYTDGFHFSIYNFSMNSQFQKNESWSLKSLREIWQCVFDQAFDILYAAGFVQREQNELFKASLFKEATESFKKAMEFPLIEPSER